MKSFIRIEQYIFYIFLLFTLFFSVSFTKLKLLLLFILLLGALYIVKSIPRVYVITMVVVLFNVISMLHGIINNAPGAIRVVTTDIIYPILFPFLFFAFVRKDNINIISKILLIAATAISIYDILYVLSQLNFILLPSFFYIKQLNLAFSYYGYTHFSSSHLNVLFFTFPFSIALLFSYHEGGKKVIKKGTLVVCIILQGICALLSTRVALMFICVLSPIAFLFIQLIVKKERKGRIISKNNIYFMVCVVFFLGICFCVAGNYLEKIFMFALEKFFNESKEGSEAIRSLQSKALLSGWLESPLFGHGSGSFTDACIRDIHMPWAYEKTYHALLFQKGIVGTTVQFSLYIGIMYLIVRFIRKDKDYYAQGIAYLLGLFCFLIANSTNPYLGKFGYMWVLYLPFCIGCLGEGKRKKWM